MVFHIFYFGWYSWFVLVLALVLPWFSLVVSLPVMLRARLRLRVADRCVRGEKIFVTLKTVGSGFAACRVQLKICCALTGETTVVKRSLRDSGGLRISVDTAHCGVLRCNAEGSRVYDYLGLFGLPVRGNASGELVVCPTPEPPEPLPDMTRFMARIHRPKPGGGFSEEHENREYRPGDSMRDIHWKLSAKTDSLVVREAQDPVRDRCLLTFDLRRPGSELDSVMSQLLWLSQWLLAHDAEHQVLWLDPVDRAVTSAWVRSREELLPLLRRILGTALRSEMPSIAERRFPDASWRYHIFPKREVPR